MNLASLHPYLYDYDRFCVVELSMITELLVDNVMEFILIQYVAIEKIVVVDDELMIRKALETQLRNKRYSVASTGD